MDILQLTGLIGFSSLVGFVGYRCGHLFGYWEGRNHNIQGAPAPRASSPAPRVDTLRAVDLEVSIDGDLEYLGTIQTNSRGSSGIEFPESRQGRIVRVELTTGRRDLEADLRRSIELERASRRPGNSDPSILSPGRRQELGPFDWDVQP